MALTDNFWDSCSETVGKESIPTLKCIPQLFLAIVDWALLLAGTTALFMIVFAGIKLVMSGGDKTKVDEGKKTLTYAILGLVLILLSFFIVKVIAYITGAECITSFGFDNCSK